MTQQNADVNQYLESLPGEMQSLAHKVRGMILETVPDALEEFKWSRPVYAKGEPFCYFHAAAKHLSLGFHEGATMEDPDGVLEGTGKQMRHTKLYPDKSFPEEQIRALLKQAAVKDLGSD